MLRLIDLIGAGLGSVGVPRPLQIPLSNLECQPVRAVRTVTDHQVHIVVAAGGPAPEGLGTSAVRKHVITVAVPLRYCERGMEGHPVNEIGQLAQPAPHRGGHLSIFQHHPLHITSPAAGIADAFPIGQGLSRQEDHSIQPLHRQTQVMHLVPLHPHIHVLQLSKQWGAVPETEDRAGELRAAAGKAHARGVPPEPPPGTEIPFPQPETQSAPPGRL